MNLAIVDLGYGNIGSIGIAFGRFGVTPRVTASAEELHSADKVILPGVGAAGYAMERIHALSLREPLRALRRPALGICLGMQLLFDRTREADTKCLGIVAGEVKRLQPAPDLPVPHMGWSKLTVSGPGCGLADGDYVYFAHSFACDVGPSTVAAAAHARPICAALRSDNWLGAQFHPERSGAAGARFLEAFLNL